MQINIDCKVCAQTTNIDTLVGLQCCLVMLQESPEVAFSTSSAVASNTVRAVLKQYCKHLSITEQDCQLYCDDLPLSVEKLSQVDKHESTAFCGLGKLLLFHTVVKTITGYAAGARLLFRYHTTYCQNSAISCAIPLAAVSLRQLAQHMPMFSCLASSYRAVCLCSQIS